MTATAPREQALLIGPRRALVGVITPPAEGAPARDFTMVILNSGIIHRVGANRLHVQLARLLSAAGFRVLRFDLSGVGDSPLRVDPAASILDTVMEDIGEAVDHVAGPSGRVAIFGLCSGAAHALLYAARDPRVVGLVLLDLWVPKTRRYHLQQNWNRLTHRRGWTNLLRGRHPLLRSLLRTIRRGDAVAPPPSRIEVAEAASSEREPLAAQAEGRRRMVDAFRPVLQRHVPMLTVFTGGLEDQHNYARQLVDAFPELDFGDSLQLEWFPDSGHTFSSEPHREHLLNLVVGWARSVRIARTARTDESHTPGALHIASLWLALSSLASLPAWTPMLAAL